MRLARDQYYRTANTWLQKIHDRKVWRIYTYSLFESVVVHFQLRPFLFQFVHFIPQLLKFILKQKRRFRIKWFTDDKSRFQRTLLTYFCLSSYSVRWTLSKGVILTNSRHHGQSLTTMNFLTFRCMHRTAMSFTFRLA